MWVTEMQVQTLVAPLYVAGFAASLFVVDLRMGRLVLPQAGRTSASTLGQDLDFFRKYGIRQPATVLGGSSVIVSVLRMKRMVGRRDLRQGSGSAVGCSHCPTTRTFVERVALIASVAFVAATWIGVIVALG